ncbi:NUDIX hydrolase, partial [Nocardioides hankookensis]
VAPDAPEPQVVEVGGSTMAADWKPVSDVLDGTVPVAPMVLEALADHRPFRHQRLGAYAVVRRGGDVLLTRISERGFHTGSWTLPGGGVDHGESPRSAVLRELREECGLDGTVGELVAVHDDHFSGTAPSGRYEDFHAVAMAFAVTVADDAEPVLTEVDGTSDAVAWVPVADVESGALPVLDLVREALRSS